MKKRIISLVLALMIVISLAACGGNNNNTATTESTAASPSTSDASAKADAGPATELNMAFLTFGTTPKDMDAVVAEINKISKDKINATIKVQPINTSAYAQQIKLMLAGQEQLDIFHTGVLGNIFDFAGQLRNGQLMPLDDLLDKYGKEVKALMADYLPCSTYNGKIYAIPTMKDMAQEIRFIMLKDIADKNGIDPAKIKTLEDIEAVLNIIKKNEPSIAPHIYGQNASATIDGALMLPEKLDYMGDYIGVLMDMTSDEMKLVNYFEQPEYIELVRLARKWYTQGLILPSVATSKDTSQTLMKAGKIFSYCQAGKPGIEGQVKAQTGVDVYSSTIVPAKSFTSAVNNFMWGIPNYSKNGEKAMAFINLMYTDTDVENLFVWGIEGKHYVKTDDGHIDYPQGVDAKTTGYGLGMAFAFGNQLTSHVWVGDPIDLYKQLDQFNKSSIKSKAYGFMFDQSNVKTEMTALTNVLNQYRQVVGQGTVDPDKVLPEFQSKLKEAGIDKVIAEKQKQLDAWKASKGK